MIERIKEQHAHPGEEIRSVVHWIAWSAALLADRLGRKIDILVTWSTPALVAAEKATSAIPIVGMT